MPKVAGKVFKKKIDLFVIPEVDSLKKIGSLHRCLTKIVFVKNPTKSYKNLQKLNKIIEGLLT